MTRQIGQILPWVRRIPRWAWIIAATLCTAWLTASTAEYFLDVERYKPELVQALEQSLGLPSQIGHLDLVFFPEPSISVQKIKIGSEKLMASADLLRLRFNWRGLLKRKIEIDQIDISGLECVLPPDWNELRARLSDLRFSPPTASAGTGIGIGLRHIQGRGVRIRRGDSTETLALCRFDVYDPLSDHTVVSFDAQTPFLGDTARTNGSLQIVSDAEEKKVSGTADIRAIDSTRLINNVAIPQGEISARLNVVPSRLSALHAEFTGEISPSDPTAPYANTLPATFSGNVWCVNGVWTFNDLRFVSPAGSAEADVTRYTDGTVACRMARASLSEEGIRTLSAQFPLAVLQPRPSEQTRAEASDLLLSYRSGEQAYVYDGTFRIEGIDWVTKDGGVVFPSTLMYGKIQNNELILENLESSGTRFSGTIMPDWHQETFAIDLSGTVQINPTILHALGAPKSMADLEGIATIEHLTAVVGENMPFTESLYAKGSFSQGALGVTIGETKETLSEIEGTFELTKTHLVFHAKTRTVHFGELAGEGTYEFNKHAGQGTLKGDLAAVDIRTFFSETTARTLTQVFQEYGASEIDIEAHFPPQPGSLGELHVQRRGKPVLSADLRIDRASDTWRLDALELLAEPSAEAFRPFIPAQVTVTGAVPIHVVKRSGVPEFSISANLDSCSFQTPQGIKKNRGIPLSTILKGDISDEQGWKVNTLEVRGWNTSAQGKIANGRIVFEPFDVDIADFRSAIPETFQLGGKARVSLETNPLQVTLAFTSLRAVLSGRSQLECPSGILQYDSTGTFRIEDAELRATDVDCRLRIEGTATHWKGTLQGKTLRAETASTLWQDIVQSWQDSAEPPPDKSQKSTGSLFVDLDHFFYRRGRFDDVHAEILVEPSLIDIRNIKARPYSGSVTGSIDITRPATNEVRQVRLDLQVEGAPARIIDEIAFLEPRSFTGTFNGAILLGFPVVSDANPLNGATGMIEFDAQNGSYGKLGMTTRLLSALRATEIFRLRIPSFRDEGLVYDTSAGTAEFRNGVMTLHTFEAKNSSFQLTAGGTIDFPRNRTDLVAEVALLGAVTGPMESVGLRGTAQTIRNYSSLRFTVTGPPTEPVVRPTTGPVVNKVIDTVRSSERTLRGVLQDTAREALRGIFGR
ncbi:MAG TPA: AsmA-like C-terminal region-containing protein [Candidatus Hydrogenedentes bacterium]|nr:AsmA-like C-terminal region-containing protein [Candidatus Hydrogenedentota bacterium]HOL75821.1 AsmA-like C-terminal region-containing protein [Candidatus Hydrogenedentota bacterium]HPO86322.1 AsmA-like C-terminal region-containing protein [Candidatus Hydrogenedentota bacterium]